MRIRKTYYEYRVMCYDLRSGSWTLEFGRKGDLDFENLWLEECRIQLSNYIVIILVKYVSLRMNLIIVCELIMLKQYIVQREISEELNASNRQ